MKCRLCQSEVTQSFVDLGHQPPSNAYLDWGELSVPEITYPLQAFVCGQCRLVQLPVHAQADELFTDSYAYFSSVSSSWVEHARQYAEHVIPRFRLDQDSLVVELASNDGYLLQFFRESGIPCLGVEPTASTAAVAREKGLETIEEFFGVALAEGLKAVRGTADLILGNNVLAHVPDINDFIGGVALLLGNEGVATFEFPHLLELVNGLQFDTIYHEHYSYLSFTTVAALFARHDLRIIDVQRLATHGGSLRVFGAKESSSHTHTAAVDEMLRNEAQVGMLFDVWYEGFQPRVDAAKDELLKFLLEEKERGKTVVGYGAAAKGNTLLNYAGVRSDLIRYVCDAAPSKQGKFLPGSHIPVLAPEAMYENRPDTVLILPWNIAPEIIREHSALAEHGTRFFKAIPRIEEIAESS